MSDGAMLTFADVSFDYGGNKVLDHLSFSLMRGEILGIVGPNGAGKSTLMRVALGILKADGGRVLLNDCDSLSMDRRAFAREVAAVMQEEAVEFPFTALEVVLMGRTPYLGPLGFEQPRDMEVARWAMQATGIEDLASRPLYELSGGERKRVFLARALAQEPKLLLLDEPAAALDIHHQIAIFDLLRQRRREGMAIAAVVHDLNLAAAYCDRVLLLEKSGAASIGSVNEILTYARIKAAFGVEIYVGVNELTGSRFFLPLSPETKKALN